MLTITRLAAAAFVVAAAACAPRAHESADVAAIEVLMRATWDRPEAPLVAGPIVVAGDHALADWSQGAIGGRALLTRRAGAWSVVLCAGDGIRTAEGLRSVGVPETHARALAQALTDRERSVDSERLLAISHFEGIVRMAD